MRTLVLSLALLCLCAARSLAAPLTFQPEVLVMRTASKGVERSYKHANLKPRTTDATGSFTFAYQFEERVTCTVKTAPPDTNGIVKTTVSVQRQRGEDITTKSGTFAFYPGKSLVVDTSSHLDKDGLDGTVEFVQLTLQK